jgi:ATP-dependent helicase/nuclease subunit A
LPPCCARRCSTSRRKSCSSSLTIGAQLTLSRRWRWRRHRRGARPVYATLSRWRERGAALPVFEFYASILSGEGGREKLVGRLGPETPDMLDEFMRFALAQERAGLPALQNFVSVLEAASPVIKREMDPAQKQVRIMTVHGAKGLEAPVVFLIDRGSAPHNSAHADGFLDIPSRTAIRSSCGTPRRN